MSAHTEEPFIIDDINVSKNQPIKILKYIRINHGDQRS